ncbi:hypothetical protein KC19_7G003500 [Ceratodon purpureus]|uniref:Uncharacterized protein n=1 Tax=Ceratodon purpureus TaxID=3225 RepID=A0A8T0H2T6_CERPU|nr:hypothetical protein KC19_7G003200 [Ceratodon purpureus]KAG0565640.1 hypothetical protein KC19_7G003500 [Ceratodon purpureus]
MFSSKAFNFLQQNMAIEPPVYYIPSPYPKLEAFATVVKAWEIPPMPEPESAPPAAAKAPPPKAPSDVPGTSEEPIEEEVPWAWDGSFSSITAGIEESTMSERIKQHFRSELVTLKELVQIPPRQTMLLHGVVYKMLHGITDYTEEVMEGMPQDFVRPMAEMLMNNYYEKYEQERLEKEAEAKAKMEQNPEAAEAEMMESLLEQINMANPPLNEISLESRIGNQDMLEYCFKWLHILTEMRMFMRVGFNDYEEQIQKEQKHLNELVNQQIFELIPFMDETSSWDRFALERAKQGLLEGQKKLLKINEKEPPLDGHRELSDCAFYESCLETKINE